MTCDLTCNQTYDLCFRPAAQIEIKVYVKPTNSGLLLHYQSHVDNRYEKGLPRTMLDRTHRLSSSWTHFSDECDCSKTVFSRLKYPKHLVNSTFSNSLIIHEEKTKEITTVKEVWICHPNYHKIRRSFALIFFKNYQCFEKLYQTLKRVFHQVSKHFEVG